MIEPHQKPLHLSFSRFPSQPYPPPTKHTASLPPTTLHLSTTMNTTPQTMMNSTASRVNTSLSTHQTLYPHKMQPLQCIVGPIAEFCLLYPSTQFWNIKLSEAVSCHKMSLARVSRAYSRIAYLWGIWTVPMLTPKFAEIHSVWRNRPEGR